MVIVHKLQIMEFFHRCQQSQLLSRHQLHAQEELQVPECDLFQLSDEEQYLLHYLVSKEMLFSLKVF